MKDQTDVVAPPARKNGLLIRELEDEVLVYDLERNQAHCLNRTAAAIWSYCDGTTTIGEMVEMLEIRTGSEADEDTVWHALLQLAQDNLLEQQVSRLAAGRRLSRRQLMKRAGIAVAAATVATIAVPAVGAHASVISVCPTPVGGGLSCCDPTSPGCQRSQNTACVTCKDGSGVFCCPNNVPNCCSGVCCKSNQSTCDASGKCAT